VFRDSARKTDPTFFLEQLVLVIFRTLSEKAHTMPELIADFQSLPPEYQNIIRLAQATFKITVAPLQLLVGGWSGAIVYLVSLPQ
jgi:hypothetical protein